MIPFISSPRTVKTKATEVASGRKRGLWEGNTMDCPSVMRLFLYLDWSAHYMSGCLSKLMELYSQSLHILLCVNYRKSSAEFFFLGGGLEINKVILNFVWKCKGAKSIRGSLGGEKKKLGKFHGQKISSTIKLYSWLKA